MAVLPALLGITAQVLIDGDPAPEIPDTDEIQIEHDDPDIRTLQAARTVSNYIESETNKRFSIKVAVGPPYKIECSKLAFHIYVDGKPAWKSICDRPHFKHNIEWEDEVSGIKEGKGCGCKERGFRFAKIETNDNRLEFTKMNRIAQRMRQVGTIEIRVYRTNYGKQGGPTEASANGFLNANGTEVPEKTLKGEAKSHGTSLGNARKVKRGKVFRTDNLDGDDHPMVIFKFKYRSEEALKQMHITERTPSPSPSSSPPSSRHSSPTPSEMQEVAMVIRRLRREKAIRVKKERVEEERGRSSTRGSSSRPAKRLKRGVPQAPAAVIDLSSDGEETG